MINENELIISNRSYINKDFASIYNEIETLARQLSYKYDPTTSNESDPFIVLLKLLAFMGDKLNYNADKNILERFMPSATQENTMRDLTSMLGYNMNYYIAPETEVYIRYVGDEEFNESHKSFTLKPLETVITDSSGETEYVLIDQCTISKDNLTSSLIGSRVMQGTLKPLSVLNDTKESEVVLLSNLDENNRIYFPEKKVAQNGVFISGGTMNSSDTASGYWDVVDNLNTQPSGKYVYIFGYDSNRGYPYVQFPDDIARLIGDGLTIKYIVTDGYNGNIGAKKLNTLQRPKEVGWDNVPSSDTSKIKLTSDENTPSPLIINNTNGSINGANPESINDAYNNYKKIIGTFDTLVTCRDYANAIYNLDDVEGIFKSVSNIQVADRRTDLNTSTNVITYSQYGEEYVNTVRTINGISAYDLMLYPLKPIKLYSVDTFKESFTPLATADRHWIEKQIENSDLQCLSHDYKYPSSSDIYAVKNYYQLKAFISTTSKVTATEGAAILSNINEALVKNFNAREVDYGYEIPYDVLLETIENADERIKSVSLYEPELETKFMTFDGTNYSEQSLYSAGDENNLYSAGAQDLFLTIVAKNVMSGRMSLFAYYDKFTFEFGQIPVDGEIDTVSDTLPIVIDNIKSITTDAGIIVPIAGNGYELNINEVVQAVRPSLITQQTYPYGINYYLTLSGSGHNHLDANVQYELGENECCVFEWTNTSNEQVVKIYKQGDILLPNFDMYTTTYRKERHSGYTHGETPIKKEIVSASDKAELPSDTLDNENKIELFTLSTNEQVEYQTINQTQLKETSMCSWIMNNKTNTINWDVNNKYMLKEGEYFFQTDLGFNVLYSYGSGTVITKNGYSGFNWTTKTIDVSVLDDVGLLGHKEYFVQVNVDEYNYLTFLEQEVTTIVQGDSIKITQDTPTPSGNWTLTNSFEPLDGRIITCTLKDGESIVLKEPSYTGGYCKIRGILDINIGPDMPQYLYGNQSMTLKDNDSHTYKVYPYDSVIPMLKSERPHQMFGGDDIDITSVDLNDVETILTDSICVYQINDSHKATNLSGNIETLVLSSETGGRSNYTYDLPKVTNHHCCFMVYITPLDGTTVKIQPTNCNLYNLVTKTPMSSSSAYALNSGLSCIYTLSESSNPQITFTLSGSVSPLGAKIYISVPKYALQSSSNVGSLSSNPNLGLSTYCDKTQSSLSTIESALYNKIYGLNINREVIDKGFNYFCNIENTKAIEYDDLSSPYAFYDYNNVANKWTLSEIEFSNSFPDISISRGSLIK